MSSGAFPGYNALSLSKKSTFFFLLLLSSWQQTKDFPSPYPQDVYPSIRPHRSLSASREISRTAIHYGAAAPAAPLSMAEAARSKFEPRVSDIGVTQRPSSSMCFYRFGRERRPFRHNGNLYPRSVTVEIDRPRPAVALAPHWRLPSSPCAAVFLLSWPVSLPKP